MDPPDGDLRGQGPEGPAASQTVEPVDQIPDPDPPKGISDGTQTPKGPHPPRPDPLNRYRRGVLGVSPAAR